ncbi:hypothetical protein IAT38_000823 [Cryptococcus sp. DSM 104549]
MGLFSLRSIKGLLMGMVLLVAYASMIIDIIFVIKVRHYTNDYPPAVIAMLVLSIVQFCWCLWYLAKSGKTAVFKASAVMGAMVFFACYNFGAIVATTVLRHHRQYCNQEIADNGDLCGVLRGTEGLGWMLFGFDLIYIVFLPILVASNSGSWGHTMHELPYEERVLDNEKAPAH